MLYVIEDIGMRDHHEDRHSVEFNIYKDFHYFAVFDGHGDEKVAVFLKLFFKDILKNELQKNSKIPVEQCLFNSFKRLQNFLPKNMAMQSGSTAVVILKQNDTLYIANVGDSRAIMNWNNKAVPITEDHKPDTPSEYERITKAGGFVIKDPFGTPRVNGNLALSRAIGDFYLAPAVTWIPDIYTVKLNSGNKYLVAASDGLWDVFSNQELISYMQNYINSNKYTGDEKKLFNNMCLDMLKTARVKGSTDNITIMIFTF